MELVPVFQGQLLGCLFLAQAQGGLQGTLRQGTRTLRFTGLRALVVYSDITVA